MNGTIRRCCLSAFVYAGHRLFPSHKYIPTTTLRSVHRYLTTLDLPTMADNDRAAKRQKKMPELQIDTTTQQSPGLIVDICTNGDAVLVVQGIAGIPQS